MKKTKKAKKAIASLAIASMAVTMVPFNALAAVPTRIAGVTAEDTAVAIADQTGYTGTAILASSTSYGMVDALTAGPLAAALKAPILLTGAGNTLDAATKAELTKLNVTKVYVTSGTAVIKQGVIDELKGMNIEVVELGGFDRAETSVNIAGKMTGVTKVAVANGIPDALSIGSIAAAANQPILLTDKDSVPAGVSAYLTANPQITSSDVIGGTGIISDAVKDQFPGADRHFGYTAYDTNNQVIRNFADDLEFDNIYVANGVTGIDALAGAPLAAQTNSAIVLTDGTTVPAVAQFTHSQNADAVVTALGGTAVVPESVRLGIAAGAVTPVPGDLSIDSVSAISAQSFKVVFNKAPADISKVVFTVKNGDSSVTVSPNWNEANTEATLTKSSIFVPGDYTVNVKNDGTDLGTSKLAITEQKVGKIEITSSKLGVTSVTDAYGVTTQTGYATYKIFDQYGVDITNLGLAQNVQFQTGVGAIDYSKGLLKITPSTGLNLLTFSGGIVVTANDTSTGVSTTATLEATSQIGTLSDFTFGELTNEDDKELTAGDSTSIFYAEYTAKDLSGNPTSNFTMLEQGLIFTPSNSHKLTTSNPNVIAELVKDPADSTKGLIKVTASTDSIDIDMPVVITAMTWTGKTSQINTTLKKQAQVNTCTIYAPTEAIASNESKAIPFIAYDQNGKEVTKYTDLEPYVTLTGAYWVRNVDGTASIKNNKVLNSGTTSIPHVISAVTKTGKYSSITVNIQKAVKADSLSLDGAVLKSNLQMGGAVQKVDFGHDKGGLSVEDQYGRDIDMTTVDKINEYRVRVSSDNPAIISATVTDGDANGYLTTGESQVVIKSVGEGSTTVHFELLGANGKVVDTKSQTFSSLKNEDIKDYTIDQLEKAIYAVNDQIESTDPASLTEREKEYKANPKVYGKTASGAPVVLAGAPILGVKVTSNDFLVYSGENIAYDKINVVANQLKDPTKTEASATLTATVQGVDGYVYTVSTPLKSSTEKPSAVSLDVTAKTEKSGIERDDDTVTLSGNYQALLGTTLARFQADGSKGTQNVYFAPKDQYGKKGSEMARFVVLEGAGNTSRANGSTVQVASNGVISGTMVTGDYITVSGTTTSGLVKNIKIVFGAGGVVDPGEEAVDKTAIGAKIADAAAMVEADYTAESWAAMQVALAAAKAVNNDADATQAEVDAALVALQEAIAGLADVDPGEEADVTVNFTKPGFLYVANVTVENIEGAAKFAVFDANGSQICGITALGAGAGLAPTVNAGDQVTVKIYKSDGTTVLQTVEGQVAL